LLFPCCSLLLFVGRYRALLVFSLRCYSWTDIVPCLFLSVVSLLFLVVSRGQMSCLARFSLLFLLCVTRFSLLFPCSFLSVADVSLLFSLVLLPVDRYRALLVSLCCFSCVADVSLLFSLVLLDVVPCSYSLGVLLSVVSFVLCCQRLAYC
jgi:hypothetical protein